MKYRRTSIATLAIALAIPSVALAGPELSSESAAIVASSRAVASSAAAAMLQAEGEGRGLDPDRARGLERAAEVSKSWKFTGEPKPGKGPKADKGPNENISARAQQVHEALAAGLSPSAVHNPDIDKPGGEVASAFNKFKAKRENHPGKGQGKGLGGPGGDDRSDDAASEDG